MAVPHILVFEPYPPMRQALVLTLRQAGWQVALARTCQEALKTFERGAYDVFLLDMDGPSEDGWKILQALQGLHDRSPVVALIGPDSQRMLEARLLGVHVLLPKPLDKQGLMAGINAALQVVPDR